MLHLGHARTFLVAWWLARRHQGELLLRFEDLDNERSRPAYADQILRDLNWLGLDWDGTPTFQSENLERFHTAAAELEQAGRAYACACSRADIRGVIAAPHAGDDADYYPGTCRGRFASRENARALTGRPAGLRFVTPSDGIAFDDEAAGHVAPNVAPMSDFLILRRDGIPAYQLAVVVDDAAQGVNHVVRGFDLLDSTPRQIALQRALGYPTPAYTHLPLVVDGSGRRLAKRADDLSLMHLRALGIRAEVIVSWAARSLGIQADRAASARDLLAEFSLMQPDPKPVVVTDALIASWQQN
jgi:glutamyl-tRNA synthetase